MMIKVYKYNTQYHIEHVCFANSHKRIYKMQFRRDRPGVIESFKSKIIFL